jgi:sensor histidine kinase YesM
VLENGDLCLTVADNGMGMDAERLAYIRAEIAKGVDNAIAASAHIGLVNVNSRIRLKYAGAYGVTVESAPGEGTRVDIRMPAQWEE